MPKTRLPHLALSLIILAPSPVWASDRHPAVDQSKAIDALIACRRIAPPTERLACVDREIDRLTTQIDAGTVAVVDKAQVERRRREQFGLAARGDALFANQPGGGEVKEVKSTLASASTDTYGKWVFVLQDGSRWHQIDDYPIGGEPRVGTPVVVTRAALNSFKMSVGGRAAIRVRRTG